MLAAQASLAGISALLALLSYQGMVTPWLLIALTFATGIGIAFYNPAAQSSIGRIVPREELAGAVSLNILGFNVARTVGPAVGGAIVALGGIFAGYLGSAVAFLAAAVLLLFWKPRFDREEPKSGAHVFAAMAAGFRCIRETAELTAVATRAFAFTLCGSAAWALMPLVARDLTGGGPEQFGMLLGALGLGAVIGAAFAHEVRRRFSTESLVRAAGVIFGSACLIIAARPGFAATFAVLVIGGAGWVQALSGFSVAGQMWAPRAVVGMVTATVSTMVFAGLALGSWAWGYLAEITSVATALVGSGLAMVVIGALGLVLPLPRYEDAPGRRPA
jgi:predicted MFS family arabinose efflux permease